MKFTYSIAFVIFAHCKITKNRIVELHVHNIFFLPFNSRLEGIEATHFMKISHKIPTNTNDNKMPTRQNSINEVIVDPVENRPSISFDRLAV